MTTVSATAPIAVQETSFTVPPVNDNFIPTNVMILSQEGYAAVQCGDDVPPPSDTGVWAKYTPSPGNNPYGLNQTQSVWVLHRYVQSNSSVSRRTSTGMPISGTTGILNTKLGVPHAMTTQMGLNDGGLRTNFEFKSDYAFLGDECSVPDQTKGQIVINLPNDVGLSALYDHTDAHTGLDQMQPHVIGGLQAIVYPTCVQIAIDNFYASPNMKPITSYEVHYARENIAGHQVQSTTQSSQNAVAQNPPVCDTTCPQPCVVPCPPPCKPQCPPTLLKPCCCPKRSSSKPCCKPKPKGCTCGKCSHSRG